MRVGLESSAECGVFLLSGLRFGIENGEEGLDDRWPLAVSVVSV